ncbi:MAG: 6,7-dimethyl-8-ribityllumazine synthase [Candidatus Peribacteraceae bacterium]|nr:6,7-dimethyl-8-ribityllumazine synthase [Candidatus Peribacteraceae bacterium]
MPNDAVPDFRNISADPSWKIAIVRGMWHGECTAALMESAIAALEQAGVKRNNIICAETAGAFELPLAVLNAFEKDHVDGVIAIGVVVQGETHHAQLVADQAAAGLMQVQLQMKKPVAFEVLYVNRLQDAVVRSVGKESKGRLAAQTLLSCLASNGKIH